MLPGSRGKSEPVLDPNNSRHRALWFRRDPQRRRGTMYQPRTGSSRKLETSSSLVTVAVPSLLTTTALPRLAISAASLGVASQASAIVKSAIGVSPSPETSNTWRLLVGMFGGTLF